MVGHNTIFIFAIFVSESVTWCMFVYLLLAAFQAQASKNFKNHFFAKLWIPQMGYSMIMPGRYICMSVVRQKSLEQIHNNKQLFPFTLFMADRCYIYSCMLSEKLIKITIIQKFTFKYIELSWMLQPKKPHSYKC